MEPRVLEGVHHAIASILDGAAAQMNQGLVPFFTSPYGIGVLVLLLFLFLNSSRRRL